MMEISTRRRPRTARRASIAAILETLESRVVMSATPTATLLTASNPTVGLGQGLTLTASIAGLNQGNLANQGTVTIRDGSTVLGTVPVVDGMATLTTTALAIGTHRFSATYSGGPNFLPSRTEVQPSSPARIIAGSGAAGYAGDGGPATSARLNSPFSVAADASGGIYIADMQNGVVRKVDADGIISTYAGNGAVGSSGDGGPATGASFVYPNGLALDAAGNLLITTYAAKIRKVGPDGIITTVAGTGVGGYSGDGGPAIAAQLHDPQGPALDAAGNLYFAEYWNSLVRKVSTDGIITTVAGIPAPDSLGNPGYSGDGGPATAARVNRPLAVTTDAAGIIYIADTYNNVVRRVGLDGIITTIGSNGTRGYSGDGGPATAAQLDNPFGIATDASGNLYIADGTNQVIRRISPDGIIATVVGGGTSGDGAAANATRLGLVRGMSFDPQGNLYFADFTGNVVRMVSATTDVSVVPAATTAVLATSATSLHAGRELMLTANVVSDAGIVDEGTATFRDGSTVLGTVAVVNGSAALAVSTLGVGPHQLNVSYDGGSRFAESPISATTRVDVTPAPAGFRITVAETSVLTGFVQTFTVTAVDADGNPVADFDGWLTISTTDPMPSYSTSTVKLIDGVGTFQFGVSTAGVQRIGVVAQSDPVLTGEIALAVRANRAAKFAIVVERGLAGRQLRVSVTAQDFNGNTALDYDGPIRFFSSDPAAVLPADAMLVDGRGEFTVVFLKAGNWFLGVADAADPALASGEWFQALSDPDAIDPYPDATFVQSLYRNVLGRIGGDGEVQAWVDGLRDGMTRQEVSSAFVRSIEHRVNQVGAYYWDYLNRAADPASQFWVDALLAGASESSVIAGILSSEEYLSARQDDAEFIHNLYSDVLGRSADTVGMADKTAALASGATRASLVAGIVSAPEAVDFVLDGYYRYYLGRRRDPFSAVWRGILDQPGGSAAEVLEGILASQEFYRVSGKIPILAPPSHTSPVILATGLQQ